MNFISGRLVDEAGLRFEAPGITLPVGDNPWLQGFAGKEVDLGVRPEDLYVASDVRAPATTSAVPFRLEVMEPMGNEIFVYARTHDQEVVARVAPQAMPRPGETITLGFDLSKLHWFDQQTERALG